MSHQWYTLDELARQLGQDRREIEKLVNRGRIPCRKISGEWQFHPTEITHWLEQEMREYSDRQLAAVEESNLTRSPETEPPETNLLHLENIQVPLQARTRRSVLESLVEAAGQTWQIWEPATVLKAVLERENLVSTAFGNGVAIPHSRNPLPEALGESIIAYGRTSSGIPFGGPRGELTDIFFLVLCRDTQTHLRTLARLGRLIQTPGFLDTLRDAEDSQSSYEIIQLADEKITSDG